MQERGISVKQLSEITGIPDTRIYKWQSGTGNPKAEDSEKLQEWITGEKKPGRQVDVIQELTKLMDWRIRAEAEISVLRKTIEGMLKDGGKSIALVSAELSKAIEMTIQDGERSRK